MKKWLASMRKRDEEHSFHYNAMRCNDAHISYHHILYSTYCLCTKEAFCENEFDGQGPEVFALFSFEIFITFFRTIHTMDEDSIKRRCSNSTREKNMKYMRTSRYIISVRSGAEPSQRRKTHLASL